MAGWPIPLPQGDAFKRGFLSEQYAGDVVDCLNALAKWTVITGGSGSAVVIPSVFGFILDLTNFSQPLPDIPGQVTNASTATVAKLKVSLRTSIVKDTFAQTDLVPINGLGTPLPVAAKQSIYLRCDVAAKTATVGVGVWPQYPSPIGWVNPNAASLVQKYAYVSLARIYTNNPKATITPDLVLSVGNTTLSVYQLVRTGLALLPMCYGGANVLMLQPWHDGYAAS